MVRSDTVMRDYDTNPFPSIVAGLHSGKAHAKRQPDLTRICLRYTSRPGFDIRDERRFYRYRIVSENVNLVSVRLVRGCALERSPDDAAEMCDNVRART